MYDAYYIQPVLLTHLNTYYNISIYTSIHYYTYIYTYIVYYLERLHDRGMAECDHTSLLLTCYTKLKYDQKIDYFVDYNPKAIYVYPTLTSTTSTSSSASAYVASGNSPSSLLVDMTTVSFDIESAVRILLSAGYIEQAFKLAYRHRRWVLCIQIKLTGSGSVGSVRGSAGSVGSVIGCLSILAVMVSELEQLYVTLSTTTTATATTNNNNSSGSSDVSGEGDTQGQIDSLKHAVRTVISTHGHDMLQVASAQDLPLLILAMVALCTGVYTHWPSPDSTTATTTTATTTTTSVSNTGQNSSRSKSSSIVTHMTALVEVEVLLPLFHKHLIGLYQFIQGVYDTYILQKQYVPPVIIMTLLELLLEEYEVATTITEKSILRVRIMTLLDSEYCRYDRSQALLLTGIYHLSEGHCYLLEQMADSTELLLRMRMESGDAPGLIAILKREGCREGELYIQVLQYFVDQAASTTTGTIGGDVVDREEDGVDRLVN